MNSAAAAELHNVAATAASGDRPALTVVAGGARDLFNGENEVDLSRDALLTPFGIKTLKDRYMHPQHGETSPQHAFMRAARAFSDDPAMAQRMYSYASRGWMMFATPVLTNAPVRKTWGSSFADNFQPHHFLRAPGLPISCFLNAPGDSRVELNDHYSETAMLSSVGGGVGAYWGGIRSNGMKTSSGSESAGMIPFVGIVDRSVLAFAQGRTRRASYAAYLDMDHPEILEFMDMRKATGGDLNRKSLNLHNGVCIPDRFMEIIERCMEDPDADDSWDLIDPHTKQVVKTVSAKMLWEKLMRLRGGDGAGEPYIMFTDTVNRALPEVLRKKGFKVTHSNLCTEITLIVDRLRTAVCCLSSTNAATSDEWIKDPQFIRDLTRFLDNVLEYFIIHAELLVRSEDVDALRAEITAFLEDKVPADKLQETADLFVEFASKNLLNALRKAVYSAKQERSLGIGMMGFHSFLQKCGIPFESALAIGQNVRLAKHIKTQFDIATRELAAERGECPDADGTGVRNMHGIAIAPNASSSIFIPGGGGNTSPSIETLAANAFVHKTQSGSWLVKNQYLEALLERYGKNTDEVWNSILIKDGSCQHLDFLTDYERDTFKTSYEIDQLWAVEHVAVRTPFVCQSQSFNIYVLPGTHVSKMHQIHFQAWKKGVKTMYYARSREARKAEAVGQRTERAQVGVDGVFTLSENALAPSHTTAVAVTTDVVCLACEG